MSAPSHTDSLADLDELAAMLAAHEGPPHALRPASSGHQERRRPALRLRVGVVGVAALLLGSGLGFGLASSVTPNGSAGTPYSGYGFLPAHGWTVLQSGTAGSTGVATAVAANVPLTVGTERGGGVERALASLPARGVVIEVTFSTRGDPGEDYRFVERRLPLRVADATPVPPLAPGAAAEYRLTAAVRGHNVDVRLFYASSPPSPQAVAAAERQLERLVVASERVTLVARPTIVGAPPRHAVTLFGSVDSGKADELVDIQAKDCGQRFFRGVTGTTTRDGGQWTTEYVPGITTSLRAVWKGHASAPVVVRAQATVVVRRVGRALEVGVNAKAGFWRRHVLVQQRRQGAWRDLKTVLLTEQGATTGFTYVYTLGRFRLSLPRGTQIRAVLPASEARPCYLASVSNVLRI